MFEVQIKTWVNGTPTIVKSFPVKSKEEGIQVLRNIGHSWVYNMNHAGYLTKNSKIVARLDIFQFTYKVYEVN